MDPVGGKGKEKSEKEIKGKRGRKEECRKEESEERERGREGVYREEVTTSIKYKNCQLNPKTTYPPTWNTL